MGDKGRDVWDCRLRPALRTAGTKRPGWCRERFVPKQHEVRRSSCADVRSPFLRAAGAQLRLNTKNDGILGLACLA